jgi:3-oxoacyl-[acyl-carrier protein] reductase
LGPLRIRVAGIAPGYTQTQTTLNSMSEAVIKQWKGRTPLRRFAEVDEIAQGVLFILENDFFNGRILQLDGGLRL